LLEELTRTMEALEMICPKCKSRAIGKIGYNQYYCWDCNIEFVPTENGVRMYRLEPNGTAMPESFESVAQTFATQISEPSDEEQTDTLPED